MRKIFLALLILILTKGYVQAAEPPVHTQTQQQPVESTIDRVEKNSKAYAAKLQTKLNEISQKLIVLGDQLKQQSGELRKKSDANLKEWNQQLKNMQLELNKLKAEGQKAEETIHANLKALEDKIDALWKRVTSK